MIVTWQWITPFHKDERQEAMLVLTRKKQQQIMIGDDIVIKVVEIRRDRVRIGIEAPQHCEIHRQEVYDAIQRERQFTPASSAPSS